MYCASSVRVIGFTSASSVFLVLLIEFLQIGLDMLRQHGFLAALYGTFQCQQPINAGRFVNLLFPAMPFSHRCGSIPSSNGCFPPATSSPASAQPWSLCSRRKASHSSGGQIRISGRDWSDSRGSCRRRFVFFSIISYSWLLIKSGGGQNTFANQFLQFCFWETYCTLSNHLRQRHMVPQKWKVWYNIKKLCEHQIT